MSSDDLTKDRKEQRRCPQCPGAVGSSTLHVITEARDDNTGRWVEVAVMRACGHKPANDPQPVPDVVALQAEIARLKAQQAES